LYDGSTSSEPHVGLIDDQTVVAGAAGAIVRAFRFILPIRGEDRSTPGAAEHFFRGAGFARFGHIHHTFSARADLQYPAEFLSAFVSLWYPRGDSAGVGSDDKDVE
jgi:hypothetical protein